jgi:hypothetical protein
MAMTGKRTSWWLELRWERLLATSVTIALHLSVAMFLVAYRGSNESDTAGRDQVILVSIHRARARAGQGAHGCEGPPKAAGNQARSTAACHCAGSQSRRHRLPARRGLPRSRRLGRQHRAAARLLDAGGPASFERNPLARHSALAPEAPVRMAVTFTDRSLGGMLQRMTSASSCRDLRMRLTTSPESAAGIIASMQRIGCKG